MSRTLSLSNAAFTHLARDPVGGESVLLCVASIVGWVVIAFTALTSIASHLYLTRAPLSKALQPQHSPRLSPRLSLCLSIL